MVFLALGMISPHATAAEHTTNPNFIILFVDDWGWRDAACYGSDLYETPNIDKLAATGVRFTNGYSACTVCSPTRNALMTGMYPGRTNCTDFIAGHVRPKAKLRVPDWNMKLDHGHTTIAEALKKHGYATAHVGKWHLMPRGQKDMNDYLPTRHGFDINVGGNEWGLPGSYHYPYKRKNRYARAVTNLPPGGKPGDYLTDFLTDHALKFIASNKDKPFFLNFCYYNVHTPLQGRVDLVKRYEKKLANMPHSDRVQRHKLAVYAAMVHSVDESVGRIMKKLDELDIADNTVIILAGDNGGLDRNNRPTDNHPLRQGKGHVYEGGTRVPTIIRWPGKGATGAVSHTPVMTIDFYPTMLKIAGLTGVAAHNKNVDGASLIPVLRDPSAKLDRDLFWHYPHYHTGGATPHGAVRSGDYKLIEFYEDMRVELYNVKQDIGEKNDLAPKSPNLVQTLRDKLHAWRKKIDAQMPTKNPNYVRN